MWGSNIISVNGSVNIKMDKTVTPVKTFTRTHLTPSTKEFCALFVVRKSKMLNIDLNC